MADKPILFSAPMVRALLAGQKTQTRRAATFVDQLHGGPFYHVRAYGGGLYGVAEDAVHLDAPPYAPHQPGDALWVREAWRVEAKHDATKPTLLTPCRVGYGADETPGSISRTGKLRPSMFMPRWASRLTLVVTETRVQRLQEITPADAIAEGCRPHANSSTIDCDTPDPRDDFAALWDNINGKRPGLSWAENPWIVAYSFDVYRENVDSYLGRTPNG